MRKCYLLPGGVIVTYFACIIDHEFAADLISMNVFMTINTPFTPDAKLPVSLFVMTLHTGN